MGDGPSFGNYSTTLLTFPTGLSPTLPFDGDVWKAGGKSTWKEIPFWMQRLGPKSSREGMVGRHAVPYVIQLWKSTFNMHVQKISYSHFPAYAE